MLNQFLSHNINFLHAVVSARLEVYFETSENSEIQLPAPPSVNGFEDALSNFVAHYQLTYEELVMLISTLVPHVIPGFFDQIVQKYIPKGGEFPLFGGAKGSQHRGMLPTAETILFLLGGTEPQIRLKYMSLFAEDHYLLRDNILSIEHINLDEPWLSGRLIMDPEFVEVFTTGKVALPKLSINFPAQHISTELEWEDLILSDATMEQIKEIEDWIHHNDTLMQDWGMGKKLKPGYRALFYGPPGTGKTLTSTLLGKYTGRPVFRVDVSTLVSKFIGETEKNLAALFDKAENKKWILFFDEADSIFGKRTGVRDAHDKYANQEVSYLLQRIEAFEGLIILATNFKNNIDHAFARRFNSIIFFPKPSYEERLALWNNAFPEKAVMENGYSFEKIAKSFEVTGSQIMNIVQHVCLRALACKSQAITADHIIQAIQREHAKEGK